MHEEDYEAAKEIPSSAPPAHAAVNGVPEGPSAPDETTASSTEIPPLIPGPGNAPFFQCTDWLSFALTTGLVLAVYLFTLAPEVTLADSGILSTAAMYGGGAHPPGFPIWTIYAWLFTKLLPFSNIAWRIGVSSAVAGALTCGVLALMVSRGGAMLLEGLRDFKRLELREEKLLRIVAASVAGMGFGFNGDFWRMAVVVETIALTNLLFSMVLCLLVRWSYSPERTRYLYWAFLVYGLTFSANPILIPAALGLPFFVMFAEQRLGRELFFAAAILSAAVLVANYPGWLAILAGSANPVRAVYVWICVLTTAMCLGLIVKTRGFFSKWRPALAAGLLSLVGGLPYFYLPLASMTNPPINWGYARELGGFIHLITRGQFGSLYPTHDLGRLAEHIWMYGGVAARQYGLTYLLAALIPFFFLRRMRAQERGLLFGLLAFYLCLSLFILILANPPKDRDAVELIELYFSPSYLILAVWTGYGLVLAGTGLTRDLQERMGKSN